jgi:hypothetical protein
MHSEDPCRYSGPRAEAGTLKRPRLNEARAELQPRFTKLIRRRQTAPVLKAAAEVLR